MSASTRKQQITDLFDRFAAKQNPWSERSTAYYRYLTKLVGRLAPAPGRVLELGSGDGDLLASLGSEQAIGVDVHQWGEVDIVVDDSAALPFPDSTFDTITIIAALNHIPNRTDVLEEARRVLREEGAIILTMIPPHISALWHLARKRWDIDQKERGMKEGEVYGLTRRSIRRALNEAGLRVSHEGRFMLGINYLVIAKKRRVCI